MTKILVSGLINIETTLQVDSFPLNYEPVRYPFFGVNSTVSGVGYNIAKALTKLGNEVNFLSIIGQDIPADTILSTLAGDKIAAANIIGTMPQTAQSVIIYDRSGRRQIHTDLKDIQDRQYPTRRFEAALNTCSAAVLCNINYNRQFLQSAKTNNIPIATDVHTISDLEDVYNRDFMAAAQILFFSDENLPCPPEQFVEEVQKKFSSKIIVVGLGSDGALLAVKESGLMRRFPAQKTRPIVNTIGAGDALFSSFIHQYFAVNDPIIALQKAIIFASYKIGEAGAAEGFLTERELEILVQSILGSGLKS